MKRSLLGLTVAVSLCMLGGTGCQSFSSSNWVPFTEMDQDFAPEPGLTKLTVKNRVGDIRVAATPSSRILIQAKVVMDASRVATAQQGTFADWVKVSTAGDTLTVADAGLGRGECQHWHVSLSVQVPAHLNVAVNNGTGDITIENTESDIHARVGVGEITVRGPTAKSVDANTGTGDMRIEVARLQGAAKLNTGVGQARLVADSVEGLTDVSTGTGDIRVSINASAPKNAVKVGTGVGDVHVRIPPDAAGRFRLSTGVGDVQIRRAVEPQPARQRGPGHKMEFATGQNGPDYDVHTGTGAITLE